MMSNNKYGPQLRMSIVHCSSQDEVFPITELQSRTIHTSGWQSEKYCEYPQELGFRFEGEVDVQHLRILCHEAKIPSRIEIFICEAGDEERRTITFPPYDQAIFRRLGHINLASNEENNFAARELKTINVRRNAIYLKLIIRKNHSNLINVFNQVGIVALSAHGSVLLPFRPPQGVNQHNEIIVGGEDEVPMEQIFVANKNEREKAALGYDGAGGDALDDTHGGTLDAITGRKVRELTLHKARAIEQEDYDLAKALKEQIEQLKEYGAQIAVLDAQKLLAVEAEEYDKAKQLKMQIDELRARSNARPGQPQKPGGGIAAIGGLNRNHSNSDMCGQHQGYAPAPSNAAPKEQQHFGERPAVKKDKVSFDDQPAAPSNFDDLPAVAGGGKKNAMMDEYPPGYKPPKEASPSASDAPKPVVKRSPPPKASPRASGGPAGNDELACTAKGEVDVNDETGGIVVKAPVSVSLGKVAQPDGEKMTAWEKALNSVACGFIEDQSLPELLASAKLTEYKDYINIFGNFVTCGLFSKKWQLREASLKTIISTEGYNVLMNMAPQGYQAIPQLLLYLGAKGFGVDDGLANVFFVACDALSLIVSEKIVAKGTPIAQLHSSILPLLPQLMLKAGDNNARVREKASGVLMQIATSSIGPDRISSAALLEPETGGSKKPLSFRIHLARIHIISSLIEELGLKPKMGLSVDGIMQRLCMPCLSHSHQDVREASQKLVAVLSHHSTPSALEKYLGSLKPAQRQLIDEQIAAFTAAGGLSSGKNMDDGPAVSSSSPARSNPKKKNTEPEMVSSSFSVGNGQAEVLAAARAAIKQPSPPQAHKRDPNKFCQYCNKYDERFTEDNLDLHLVRDCPMLCPCPLCGQVTEISQLQPHLVTECDNRSMVKQCPLCLEAVRAEDLEAHVEAAECIPAEPNFSLCPLCHAKFPAGPQGWIKHFASSPGCPNNPRPYDGGDIGIQ